MRRPDCFLCGDLTDRGGRFALDAGLALTSDIAPLAPGHLLLFTESHVGSFAAADTASLERFEKAINRVLDHPVLQGRPVLLFEHGTDGIEPMEAGCTDHAHIHILPVPLDQAGLPATTARTALAHLRDGVAGPSFRFKDIGQLAGTDYFWLADRDLVVHTVRPRHVERQVLRQIIAEAAGLAHHRTWDLFDEDAALETMNQFGHADLASDDLRGT